MQRSPQGLPPMQILQQPEGAAVSLAVVLVLPEPELAAAEPSAAELSGAELEPPPVPGANVSLGISPCP